MANYTVLLIRRETTFRVKALVTNLERSGYCVQETGFDAQKIATCKDTADIMILHADDETGSSQDTLDYLRELCREEKKKLILIGSEQEIADISAFFPLHLAADLIERPLDMNLLLDKINALTDQSQVDRRKRLLLVDDDTSYLMLLREWLKEDYRIGMAKSGTQAKAWLERNLVDLILLDYEMPETTGAQVFAMLKNEEYSKDVPVMFLTGKSDQESIKKVWKLNPAGYMLKSVSKDMLLATLDKFFSE